jgi:hypothetical protein
MKTRKSIMVAMAVMLVMTWVPVTYGAVSPEEAAKLGTTLTPFGAETEGNKDGTIPAYTGGLNKPPANYKMGSGVRPDPFASEKPLFTINAQNMAQYADKLTEGTKAIMKKFPTFRIDVYKTHRTVAYPENVLKNTVRNAMKATTHNDGLSISGARAGIPFPIPKDGYEVMWNHLLRYLGRAWEYKYESHVVDSNGRLIITSQCLIQSESPYYDEDQTRPDADLYWKSRVMWTGPARKAGECMNLFDSINPFEKERIIYQYLPGQRRIKLAPEVAFDGPSTNTGGNCTYDENMIFNGSMERYTVKFIGKKEFYVPYNTYKATYTITLNELLGPNHVNPDVLRWELHRIWVVEGTLKPGKRHIYPRRVLYIDEDSWTAIAGDNYDANGNFFNINFNLLTQNYDMQTSNSIHAVNYNMTKGLYINNLWAGNGGFIRAAAVHPERDWSPQTMAGSGLR